MAVTATPYGGLLLSLWAGEINAASHTFKALLTTSSYTPNQGTHRYRSSVTNEVTGTGYTAGGATLTGVTATYNASTRVFTFTANNVDWADSTITARRVVVYRDTGTASTSPLLCWGDFDTDRSSSAGLFRVAWNAAGLLRHTVPAPA